MEEKWKVKVVSGGSAGHAHGFWRDPLLPLRRDHSDLGEGKEREEGR